MAQGYCGFRLLIPMLLLTSAAGAAEAPLHSQAGTYGGTEVGDLNYLVLDTPQGSVSYACGAMTTDVLDRLGAVPIVVEYRQETTYIEGAGGDVTMDVVTRVFLPDRHGPDYGVFLTEGQRP